MPLKKSRFARVVRMSSSGGRSRWGIHIPSDWLEDQEILVAGDRNPLKQSVSILPRGRHAFLVSAEGGLGGEPLSGHFDVDLLRSCYNGSEDSEENLWKKLTTVIHEYYLAGYSLLSLKSTCRFSREITNKVRDLVQEFAGGDFVGQREGGKTLTLRFRGARVPLRDEKGLHAKVGFMADGINEVLIYFKKIIKKTPQEVLESWDETLADYDYLDWQERFTDLSTKELIRDCVYVTSILHTAEAEESFMIKNEIVALALQLKIIQLEQFMDHLYQASIHLRKLHELEREFRSSGEQENYLEIDNVLRNQVDAKLGIFEALVKIEEVYNEIFMKKKESSGMALVVQLLNLKVKSEKVHQQCIVLRDKVEQILSPRVAIYTEGIVGNLERMGLLLRKLIESEIELQFGESVYEGK